jgi:hypothetical protein
LQRLQAHSPLLSLNGGSMRAKVTTSEATFKTGIAWIQG